MMTADAADAVIIDMSQAFQKADRKKLTVLLPQAKGHLLEPWAAFWELRVRLGDATDTEVKNFLQRYAGTYQEDRMRNDWLLLLGERREWTQFEREYALYRMRDDKEIECYARLLEVQQKDLNLGSSQIEEIRRTWLNLRQAEEGCTYAVSQLLKQHKFNPEDVWLKVRLSVENNRKVPAREALKLVSEHNMAMLDELFANGPRFFSQRAASLGAEYAEWMTLALIKAASSDYDNAIKLLQSKSSSALNNEQKRWAWGVVAKQAAQQFDDKALEYFTVAGNAALSDDILAWKVRAALRAGKTPAWAVIQSAVDAMSPAAQKEPAWVYWRARAWMGQQAAGSPLSEQALAALQSIAGAQGFYEQLASEELGKKIAVPPRPLPPQSQETAAAKANPLLQRALYAIKIGLRQDGVREWNYATGLVDSAGQRGRLNERERLAAAQLACDQAIWDRCINTSERSVQMDAVQRYPMPFKDDVVQAANRIGLSPAYVYGLIRQESRFILDAQSSVGASGLMQIMPATAKWTAKKIGLKNFRLEQLQQRQTNIAIGTNYLKMVLDNFEGSMPMAAAAYNAGPSRPRRWRNGPVMEGAAWAECIPFSETRDYVKKVLANTTMYAALIHNEPQSLKARLGVVGPRYNNGSEENAELP
ncbi:MAG: lytic transglycosylase domain-containing protein [Burkholderiales bacterium]|nr:lytic transglycosylase domain-containing protein [Burkholderiales bacterium]